MNIQNEGTLEMSILRLLFQVSIIVNLCKIIYAVYHLLKMDVVSGWPFLQCGPHIQLCLRPFVKRLFGVLFDVIMLRKYHATKMIVIREEV